MDDLVVNDELIIPGSELRISFARSGGPGGQNVNKVSSKVDLRWAPAASAVLTDVDREWLLKRLAIRLTSEGDLVVTSSRTRDQVRNREDALEKLAQTIRKALLRPKHRRRTRPSRAAIEQRLQEKKQRSRLKTKRKESDLDG